MAQLELPDGVTIHWEEHGSGPLVVLASYWSFHPSVFEPITRELERDHRVVRYDDRGAGESTRAGPYDMDAAAADLAAVIEEAGGPAVVIATADASQRAVRAAAEHPDLIDGVVSMGGPPLGRRAFPDSDAMAASETVVNALVDMASTDYRAALRTIVTAANPQMSDEELRDRVRAQSEYAPAEAAVSRLRAWSRSDSADAARKVGDRLWILHSPELGGGWFPTGRELVELIRTELPEAHVEEIEDGMVSRPDLTAGVVRRITSAVRAQEG